LRRAGRKTLSRGTRRFLFLQGCARAQGNAQAVARLAASILPIAAQDWRDQTAPALEPFADLRQGGPCYAPTVGVARVLAEAILAANDIFRAAPQSSFGRPAPSKLSLDHWSHWMRVPELGFKAAMAAKRMWLMMSHAS
jgi:hypothetical protein